MNIKKLKPMRISEILKRLKESKEIPKDIIPYIKPFLEQGLTRKQIIKIVEEDLKKHGDLTIVCLKSQKYQ